MSHLAEVCALHVLSQPSSCFHASLSIIWQKDSFKSSFCFSSFIHFIRYCKSESWCACMCLRGSFFPPLAFFSHWLVLGFLLKSLQLFWLSYFHGRLFFWWQILPACEDFMNSALQCASSINNFLLLCTISYSPLPSSSCLKRNSGTFM